MKTLLAATDFSESAKNAVDYAARLAVLNKAKLILFHAFHVPIVASEVPTLMFTLSEMEKEGMVNLKEEGIRLSKENPGLETIHYECVHGFALEGIESLVKKHQIDLVVMGLQGANYLSEKLIGSNTSALVKQAFFPILVIHQELKFREIKRILLAYDLKEIRNVNLLAPLKEIANTFSAEIHIVHVTTADHAITDLSSSKEGKTLAAYFEGIDHSFFEVKAEDVENGINTFADTHKTDLTVVISREHSLLESFFNKDHVRNMVYHSHTPLLTLHT